MRRRKIVRAATLTLVVLLALPVLAQTTEQREAPRQFTPPPPRPIADPELLPPPPWDLIVSREPELSLSDQNQSLLGRTVEALPPPPAVTVLRAIVGIVMLMVLAYLAGARRVQVFERQFNIAHFMTTGLPFFLLGFFASLPAVGILTTQVLREIAPLLTLGLGWIGFVVGCRFDARSLNQLPEGVGPGVLVMTLVPIAMIGTASLWTLWLIHDQALTGAVIRDSFVLALAGTMAARSAPDFLRSLLPDQIVPERLARVVELEQLAGVFGLLMVSAFSRPPSALVAWQLPGTAWLFITLGLGTTMGVIIYATLSRMNRDPQFTAVLLGSVAFTAGIASFLRLSPLSVAFIAGAVLISIGGEWRHQVRHVFGRLERPVYFLFMVIAGALWHPWEWQGWLLMAAFVVARFLSKWVSSQLLGRVVITNLSKGEQRALTAAPMGALSVAIVVTAQDLYSGPTVSWIVTAVIGGSLITEAALQLAMRRVWRTPTTEPAPAYEAATRGEID